MKRLVTKQFSKWAKKSKLPRTALKHAADEIASGQVDAALGHRLFKKRIGLEGKGKRGSVRTIAYYDFGDVLVYIHGFAKNEKANLTPKELKAFKVLADILDGMTEKAFEQAIKDGSLEELE